MANEAPPVVDLTAPPAPVQVNPEHDPNLLLQNMIANRKGKKTPKKENETLSDVEREALDTRYSGKSKDDEAKGKSDATDALASAMGFRKKPAEKKEPKKEPDEEASKPAEVAPDKTEEDEEKPKTSVTKRKADIPIDPAQIATAAATAATREAMKGMQQAQPKTPSPADGLAEDDRHEYEVAEFLSKSNPKYKDAPRIVLAQIKKANDHAARWESANPGKTFNPDDEEHADFFDGLDEEKPWTTREFRRAENKMDSAPDIEESIKPLKEELAALKKDTLVKSLEDDIGNAQVLAIGALAKAVGDDVLEMLTKEKDGGKKLAEKEPIVYEELSRSAEAVRPFIRAIIQLEVPDEKRRVPFDENNPDHKLWLQLLNEQESKFIGQRDASGKIFARRYDYNAMSPADRPRYWFLDTQMFASEVVNEVSKLTQERIKTEKEKLQKRIEAMGYVPKPTNGEVKNKADATRAEENNNEPAAPIAPQKPVSPTASGSVPIDNKAEPPNHGVRATMAATRNILFGR